MVDDAHSNGSDPDAVIPPPPAAPPGDLASSVPLAPPLSGPPAPHPPAPGGPFGPPAPPLPPYASAPQAGQYPPQYPAVPYPAQPPQPPQPPYVSAAHDPAQSPHPTAPQPGQNPGPQPSPPPGQYSAPQPGQYPAQDHVAAYPLGGTPAPARSGKGLAIVLAAVGAFVVIVVVGIAVAVGLLLNSAPDPISAPVPTVVPTAPGGSAGDSDEPSAEEPPSDDPGDADASGIADVLQSKIDEYKQLRDSGALWEKIPDNEFNRTAVSAFLYFLVDMKSATLWGVDEAQAQEYQERMTTLEERLLAQQPLGDDIKITLEDKVFTYDGTTGEGGYVEE